MKLALLCAVVPLASLAGVPTWRVVDSGVPAPLWGVATLDETTAVAVGSGGIILRSEDAGETWADVGGKESWNLFAVSFPDALHGTAVGYDYDSSTLSPLILHTDDGGFTWAPQASGLQYVSLLHGVQFLDALTGWAVGEQTPAILRTDDGGKKWRQQPAPSGGQLRSVYFTDKEHGVVVGYSGLHQSFIVFTDDGGQTWQEVESSRRWGSLFGLAFADAQNGVAVGRSRLLTEDGGFTWRSVGYGVLHSVAFAADGQTGSAVGEYFSAWTTDGGHSWTNVTDYSLPELTSVAFFESGKAVAVGYGCCGGQIVVVP